MPWLNLQEDILELFTDSHHLYHTDSLAAEPDYIEHRRAKQRETQQLIRWKHGADNASPHSSRKCAYPLCCVTFTPRMGGKPQRYCGSKCRRRANELERCQNLERRQRKLQKHREWCKAHPDRIAELNEASRKRRKAKIAARQRESRRSKRALEVGVPKCRGCSIALSWSPDTPGPVRVWCSTKCRVAWRAMKRKESHV